MSANSDRGALWQKRLPIFILIVVGVVYAKILGTFFVQDDFWFLKDTLKPPTLRLMLAGGLSDYLRPIPCYWLPLLNRHLWGLSPFGFHISQMVCLLVTVYALYCVAYRLTQSVTAASITAIVYGLSKVHLETLSSFAGGIDNTAGCFLALTLLAIVRYEQREGSLWSIGIAWALALLCKESVVILIVSWGGAVIVRSLVARFLPSETDDVGAGQDGARRPSGDAVRDWFLPSELRTGLTLAGVFAAYTLLRISLIVPRHAFGLDFDRFKLVIKHSLASILPVANYLTPISEAWILLPLALGAGALLLRPPRKAHETALAIFLWISHAAIFAISIKMPQVIFPYFAHFNLFGLALLSGLCCAGLLQRFKGSWAAVPLQTAVVLLLAVYAFKSATVIRTCIAASTSTPMWTARYSLQAYNQLSFYISDHPFREVVFLDASEEMWWATGWGDMVASMFPGVDAHFDGKKGYQAEADVKSDDKRLVLRQVSEFKFDVVR